MALIEISKLTKAYDGQQVLNEIDLNINRGETLALIGPTGSGKTTLIRLMDLLELPSSGIIRFDGIDVTSNGHDRLAARRRMALVHQKPIVFNMSVGDNVAFGLKWRHLKKSVVNQKVDDALSLIGMQDYKNRNAKTLSGGETQRIAIARALIVDPELLFLDEPTSNLDPISKAKVEEVLAHIITGHKSTVIMTTHDMLQGQQLAGTIGVMINGQLLQMGRPDDIFCSPNTREVAEFVGIDNIIEGTIVEKEDNLAVIKVNGEAIQAVTDYQIGDRVNILIRPEDITLTVTMLKDISSARNLFRGKITRMGVVGTLVRVAVDCGFNLLSVITSKSAQELNLGIGKEVYSSFKATALSVIKQWDK